MTTAHDGPWLDLTRALEAEQAERTGPPEVACPGCRGSGVFLERPCWRCAGAGRVPSCERCGGRGQVLVDSGPYGYRARYAICPDCRYGRVSG
jgi:DnaJ-class molecular chaperone